MEKVKRRPIRIIMSKWKPQERNGNEPCAEVLYKLTQLPKCCMDFKIGVERRIISSKRGKGKKIKLGMCFFKPGANIFKGGEINVVSVANSPS